MEDKEKVINSSSTKTNKIVNGIFLDAKQNIIPELKKGAMHKIVAIIMHRTASSNLNSTLSSFKKSGIGTHFIIDKNGEIIQCLNLSFFSYHIGKIKSKAEDSKSWTREEQKLIEKLNIKDKSRYEISNKKYPERYPINQESIGIEVVANYDPKTKQWDNATKEQRRSIQELIEVLKKTYNLTKKDIYEHDKISYKTEGEGANLY